MWSLLFPEWNDMSRVRKAAGLLAPVVGGIATGMSGTSSTFFYLFNTWGAISAAVTFGAEHRTRREALLRSAAAGVLYALTLVVVLHVTGNARVDAGWLLPADDLALFLIMAGASPPLHLLGLRIRNNLDPLPVPALAPVDEPAPVKASQLQVQPQRIVELAQQT